jgi:exodeoxyribonuclease VII large subunit
MEDALQPRRAELHSNAADLEVSRIRELSNVVSQLRLGALSQTIWVKGRSVEAKVWAKNPSICYGTLSDGQFNLAYRIPAASMPVPNEEVVLCGELHLQGTSFELQLHGDVVGAWEPKKRPARQAIPVNPRSAEGLVNFLERRDPSTLGFIATDIGWRDVKSAAGSDEVGRCESVLANFTSETEVVAAIKKLVGKSNVKGIVLARGGGPRLDVIGNSDRVLIALIESNLPFYTALGHSNDQLLLDKYADQSFSFPGDFGHRLRRALEDIQRLKDLNTNLATLTDQHDGLKTKFSTTTQALQAAEHVGAGLQVERASLVKHNATQGWRLRWAIGTITALCVMVVVLVTLLIKR